MEQNESEKIEAQKRFEALPENLKKEMLADKNVQVIVSTCQDYKLSEEDTKKAVLLAGEVFLGYIKPEEVASELNKYFGVELQKSNFIEIELKQKIFNGLKADLDKIYNPIKSGIPAETQEEVSPNIIKLEREAAPISSAASIPLQKPSEIITEKKPEVKPSPLTMGAAPAEPKKAEIPAALKAEPVMSEAAPFIIQTKVEAVKAAVPQFPKETPSLNLRVDPSIIQKSSALKPIAVHLETAQPVQEKRFQMPVIAGQKIFSGAPDEKAPSIQDKPLSEPGNAQIEVKPTAKETNPIPRSEPLLNLQGRPIAQEVKIPAAQPVPQPVKNLGGLMDQAKETAKTVHYSSFKTDLTHLGLPVQGKAASPKAGEPRPATGREDFINLNTFTKVSGNTVDLRKSKE